VQDIRPKNFGIIVRTIAENRQEDDIVTDLEQLKERWKQTILKLPKTTAPAMMTADLNKISAIIRDMLNDSFTAIYVDSPKLYQEIQDYLQFIAFEKTKILHLYKEKQLIFEHFNVAIQIKGSFGKVVTVKNGVYLIIEHTEAMHVIDVNSGNRLKSSQSQEDNALEVNLIAAQEIARQLRLRDMGGIICIDFIDLAKSASRTILNQKFREFMANDKAKHNILPINKFGIVQITRQRVRQAIIIDTQELCPSCQGTGKVKASILLEEELDNILDFLIYKQGESNLTIVLHNYLYAYFTKGLISKQLKWFFKYKKWIKLKTNQDFHIMEYRFLTREEEEIVLWQNPKEAE